MRLVCRLSHSCMQMDIPLHQVMHCKNEWQGRKEDWFGCQQSLLTPKSLLLGAQAAEEKDLCCGSWRHQPQVSMLWELQDC